MLIWNTHNANKNYNIYLIHIYIIYKKFSLNTLPVKIEVCSRIQKARIILIRKLAVTIHIISSHHSVLDPQNTVQFCRTL